MANDLAEALDAYGSDPCAECEQPLGKSWKERLRADGERLEKVHLECPHTGRRAEPSVAPPLTPASDDHPATGDE